MFAQLQSESANTVLLLCLSLDKCQYIQIRYFLSVKFYSFSRNCFHILNWRGKIRIGFTRKFSAQKVSLSLKKLWDTLQILIYGSIILLFNNGKNLSWCFLYETKRLGYI
ncbi:hypothetical protein RF11_02472 [Thelohanellus kitauei]|uniref:Uncharacterized protein n=1 Tax=Thelohanellus kitauei TaxID=669202 RepID=A0A0C2MSH1_THEKT|nr:hypothetical protein RF11_02472 [Thelohanellus kitauei]